MRLVYGQWALILIVSTLSIDKALYIAISRMERFSTRKGTDQLMIFDFFIRQPVSRTAIASCARFSGPYIPVGTRFSASVVPRPDIGGLICQLPSAHPLFPRPDIGGLICQLPSACLLFPHQTLRA
jgi:hypothetical protein